MVIFSLVINPSNSDSTIEKKYEKSRHTRLDFFIPIPQIKLKINIICDIENKKFNNIEIHVAFETSACIIFLFGFSERKV